MSSALLIDEPGAPRLFRDGAPGLVVTDVDSTLICQEVIEELAEAAGTRTSSSRFGRGLRHSKECEIPSSPAFSRR